MTDEDNLIIPPSQISSLLQTFKGTKLYQNICQKLNFKKATAVIQQTIKMSNSRNEDNQDVMMDEPDFGGSKRRLNVNDSKGPIMYSSPTPERLSNDKSNSRKSFHNDTIDADESLTNENEN